MKITINFEKSEIDIQDIWFRLWGCNSLFMNALPPRYTVYYKGLPIDDTPDPEQWMEEHFPKEKEDETE